MSLLLHGLSNPLYYYDWIYFNIPAGHQFLHYCDVVHKFSESVIVQRRIVEGRISKSVQKYVVFQTSKSARKYLDFLDILLSAKVL